MPTTFPSNLKELVCRGWSKDPKERPPIQEFKFALMKMLPEGETESFNSQTLPETNIQEERQLSPANASNLGQSLSRTNPELFLHMSQASTTVPMEIPELKKMYLNASEEKVEKEMVNFSKERGEKEIGFRPIQTTAAGKISGHLHMLDITA